MPMIPSMTSCHDLAVPMEVMQHVVNVESGGNPYAIGVVGAHLERQPQNLDEAVATARMLESQGYNYSVGISQVNRSNFARYGLDSYEKAFDVCPNLEAGTQILAQCYAQASGDWGKAFSCYYSGNFAKGFEDGYVQKVVDSMNRTAIQDTGMSRAAPIQLVQTSRAQPMTGADHLVRMRSEVIDKAGAALVSNVAQKLIPASAPVDTAHPSALDIQSVAVAGRPLPLLGATASGNDEIFEPLVRGPNDPVAPPPQQTAAIPTALSVDQADLRLGGHDDAFVF